MISDYSNKFVGSPRKGFVTRRKMTSLILTAAMIISLFAGMTLNANAATNSATLQNGGLDNTSEVEVLSTDGQCDVKTTIRSIKPIDSEPGKIIVKAELLKTIEDIDKVSVSIESNLDNSAFRFSSTSTKAGLFATKAWTDNEKLSMLESGLITISQASFLSVYATKISFSQDGDLQVGKTGILFTATLPVNPEYIVDWQSGFEKNLTVTIDIYKNGVWSEQMKSELFDFPPAGVDDPSGSSSTIVYTASFGTPSVTTIEPTSEEPFTVPVIMTSDSLLSGAELDLRCNADVAKITDITLASGLTANGNQSIAADGSSAKISFYGNEQSAKNDLTVATVTMQPVAEGTSSLSMISGTVAMSGMTLEYPVTVPDSPVTVEVKSQDTISTSTYVSTSDGVVTLLKYTPGTAPEEGKVPAYDGTAMYQGPDHTWLCLVKGDPDKAKIGMTDGTAASVAHPQKGETSGTPADLNNTDGRVNIVDAQIAYDLATGKYTEIAPALTDTSIDLLHWLMADVNGDETVTAQDARAIQSFIHTQEWFKDAA